MADYRLLYTDLKSGIIRGELPVISFGWSDGINESGSFSAVIPLDASGTITAPDGSGGVTTLALPQLITLERLAPGRTGVYVERGGVLLWGGIIWTAQLNVSGSTIDIGAAGFMSYLDRLHLSSDYRPVGVDQGAIAKAIVDRAMALPGANIGITMATPTVSMSRTRSYESVERPELGTLFRQLAEVEQGFTWRFNYSHDTETDPNNPTIKAAVTIDTRPLGQPTNIVLELGVNIQLLDLSLDASDMANVVTYVSTAGDTGALIHSTETSAASQTSYPRLESVVQASDIKERATLRSKAKQHIKRSVGAMERIKAEVDTTAIPVLGSYRPGDQVTLRGSYGALTVSGTYRIVDLSVSVSTEGEETADISLVPLGVFS